MIIYRVKYAANILIGGGVLHERMPGTSISERVFCGIKRAEAEYICIEGDSYIPVADKAELVMNLLEKNYDLVQFTRRDSKRIGIKEYSSIEEMFSECAWDATMFGHVFCRKSSFRDIGSKDYVKYEQSGLVNIAYYYDYLIDHKTFKGLYYPEKIYTFSIHKKSSFWRTKEKFFYTWVDDWRSIIRSLNPIYDKYKRQVINDHDVYGLGLNKITSWISMRSTGVLDMEVCRKYKAEIESSGWIDYWQICIISRVPIIITIMLRKIRGAYLRAKKFLVR